MHSFTYSEIDAAVKVVANSMGCAELRPMQNAAVTQFLKNKDVFVSLPTGNGKSLCYCILPRVFHELLKDRPGVHCLGIVVSPLVALMKDQVRSMTEKGVSTVWTGEDYLFSDMCNRKYQLIFLSPKMLLTNLEIRDMLLSQENLVVVAVDEAHCVKK